MKIYKHIIACAAAAALAAGFVSCDEDLDLPPVNAPEAALKANTSILDLKTTYWSNDRNYADTVGLTPGGEHVVIAGRVISCDSTGNIYKSLIIQDATAAMAISLDTTKIYQTYPVGEEVVIDMTGQNVGKYNGLFQMGKPNPYQSTYEISFMPFWKFNLAAQRNGLPDVTKVDTVMTTIKQIRSWSSPDSVLRYQSQLICLKDVEFVGGGTLTWANNGNNENRQLRDTQGNTITVRNSGYASFGRDVMPAGRGTVVCILSYYGTGWQLLMRTALDCHDFTGEPSELPDQPTQPAGDGSIDKPFSVSQVKNGSTGSGMWVTGYIVGWVDGASLADGAHFDAASNASQSNILLAPAADVKDVNQCIPVQLPSGTDVRNGLNLKANPSNLGRQVSIKGNLETYFGTAGLKSASLYNWGDKGAETNPDTPDTPDTPETQNAVFKKAAKITDGASYVIVASGKMALPLDATYNYGYLKVADATVEADSLTAPVADAFTFKAVTGGYHITDSYGRYLYMTGTYNSFNVSATVPDDGAVWTVEVQESGAMMITNKSLSKSIQYDKQYDSYGAYSDLRGELPTLYESVK